MNHLVNIFYDCDLAFNLLETLIKNDIRNCDEPSTLFRTDNCTTEALDYYIKLIGRNYLYDLLHPHIERIIKQQLDCELEQNKLDKSAELSKNFDNLIREAELITEAIFTSHNKAPIPFRRIFQLLQISATNAFPYRVEVGLTSINGFLFLRFFVPALLHPIQFGLWDSHIDARSLSTLSILARSLQKMANLASFSREREPYLYLLNDFIQEKSKTLTDFVYKLTAVPESATTPVPITTLIMTNPTTQRETLKPLNLNIPKDAAVLVHYLHENIDALEKYKKDSPQVKQLITILNQINLISQRSKIDLKVTKPPVSSSFTDDLDSTPPSQNDS